MHKAASSAKFGSLLPIYQNIYPWRSLNDFVNQIKSTIAYKSEDNSLIAINKPFGVGTYKVLDENVKKQNVDKVLYGLTGSPKYCLSDVLDPLTQEFNSPTKYFIIKGIDRYMSGLTLIANNENHTRNFKRSVSASRINHLPPYGLRALTSGYPMIASNKIYEKVGLELIEVDEYGDYKEPVIHMNPGYSFQKKPYKQAYQAELIVKKTNREVSSSLVELNTTSFKWDFPRCYISSKTAFILGDVRFSRRVREVLGKKMQFSAFKSSALYDDRFEPLNSELGSLLGVKKNNQIPLMLDLNCLRLKYYDKKTKKDLIIESPYTPLHFMITCKRLNLLEEPKNESVNDAVSSREFEEMRQLIT